MKTTTNKTTTGRAVKTHMIIKNSMAVECKRMGRMASGHLATSNLVEVTCEQCLAILSKRTTKKV